MYVDPFKSHGNILKYKIHLRVDISTVQLNHAYVNPLKPMQATSLIWETQKIPKINLLLGYKHGTHRKFANDLAIESSKEITAWASLRLPEKLASFSRNILSMECSMETATESWNFPPTCLKIGILHPNLCPCP